MGATTTLVLHEVSQNVMEDKAINTFLSTDSQKLIQI